MRHTLVGPLPRHIYCLAESRFFRTHPLKTLFEPVVWFGLVSHPTRAWGCTVMTEEGAVYRNLPPNAIAFSHGAPAWDIDSAQLWNCYGTDFTVLEYPYLYGISCDVMIGDVIVPGFYRFTAAPVGDAYSEAPEQAKEFSFIELENGRLTIQPTDKVLFTEASFTRKNAEWPRNLKRQTDVHWVNEVRS